jgi:hypothetical protein
MRLQGISPESLEHHPHALRSHRTTLEGELLPKTLADELELPSGYNLVPIDSETKTILNLRR